MKSPFIFEAKELLHGLGLPQTIKQSGKSPIRIGLPMISIPEGQEVTVEATFIPLGGGVSVEAEVTATLEAQCSRCLRQLNPERSFHISQVFSASDDFITGDEADEDDDIPRITDGTIDISQAVIDEAGLNLPFNPTCENLGFGPCPGTEVPAPSGVSGQEEKEDTNDPRWVGLEKYL